VRYDRLASQPRPQGAEGGPTPEDHQAQGFAPTQIRAGSCCGADLLLGGSLHKSQIPIRTCADWDDPVPGFVEIDLVGHEGGNAEGEHAYPPGRLLVSTPELAGG
jgi:hypothetical protein